MGPLCWHAAADLLRCFASTIAALLAVFGFARLHVLHTVIPFAGPLPVSLTSSPPSKEGIVYEMYSNVVGGRATSRSF
eukprot:359192-Chlamydomonas_euryale.AAC.9